MIKDTIQCAQVDWLRVSQMCCKAQAMRARLFQHNIGLHCKYINKADLGFDVESNKE